MFSPRSSSAIARSLSRISVPFTRATTASDADEVEAADEEEEDEFLEQPTAAGTMSASAAIVATVPARGRDAHNFSSGTPNNLSDVNFSNDVSNVMAAVLGKCAGPPDWRRRTLAQSLSVCNGPIRPGI